MRKFKCRNCKEINTLGDWNRNSQDTHGRLVLHEMKDQDTFNHVAHKVWFKCPTCNTQSLAQDITEINAKVVGVSESKLETLNSVAKTLYMKHWGLELDIPILVNSRMYRRSARYNKEYIYDTNNKRIGIKGKNIELSKFLVDNYFINGIIDSIKHELCHHACLSQNKPYKDHSPYFESELKRIDACSHTHSSDELKRRGHVPRPK